MTGLQHKQMGENTGQRYKRLIANNRYLVKKLIRQTRATSRQDKQVTPRRKKSESQNKHKAKKHHQEFQKAVTNTDRFIHLGQEHPYHLEQYIPLQIDIHNQTEVVYKIHSLVSHNQCYAH